MSILNISNKFEPLQLYKNINSSNYVSLQAPNDLSSSYTLTLPIDNGSPDKGLMTDENGVLSWGNSGISNNTIDDDLTIGEDNTRILTINSKINIPYGNSKNILVKQDNGTINFELPTPNKHYYQIKGRTQYFFIQEGWPSTSSQTKWQWDYETSSSIIRSLTPLLSWNSSTEFTFNKTGIFKVSIRHFIVAQNEGHLRGMSCLISDSSNNTLVDFSQHFRSFNTSDHELELFNSGIVEITSTTTVYRWSCRTGNNSWGGTGVWHKQSNTYFIVELIKEL